MAAQKDTANKSTKANTEPGQYLGLFSRVYTQGSWYVWYWSTHRTRHCLQCNHWWCSGYTVMSMCIFKCFCTHSQGIFYFVGSQWRAQYCSLLKWWIVRKAQVWVFFHLSWDISHLFFPAGTGHKKETRFSSNGDGSPKLEDTTSDTDCPNPRLFQSTKTFCKLLSANFIQLHPVFCNTSVRIYQLTLLRWP